MMRRKKVIKIPKEIDVNEIERLILQLHPTINKQVKNLSLQWTERLLLFFNEIRKGVARNELKFIENNISESDILYVQICEDKRNSLLSETSSYTKEIEEKVLYKYVKVRMYSEEKNLKFSKKGYSCQQFKFINQPKEYVKYELQTKIISKLEVLREVELESELLSQRESVIRKEIVANTDKLKLGNNYSSRAILGRQLKRLSLTPTEFIENFNSEYSSVVICDGYGRRLHSYLTNLKGGLHPHLNVGGITPVTVDIVNSQPFFSSVLSTTVIDNLVAINPRLEYLLKIKDVVARYENDTSYQKYKSICVSGQVYEHLCETYKGLYNETIERDEIKDSIFIAMFSDYSKHGTTRYYNRKDNKRSIEVFKTAFPSVYESFKEIQTINLNQPKLNVKGDQEMKKNVSYILQQVESTVMLQVVAGKLYDMNHQEGTSIFYATIHDAIMTLPHTVEIVSESITEGMKEIGINPPKLKVK